MHVKEANKNKKHYYIFVCYRWLLLNASGMAVAEIGIPTGFSANVQKLEEKNYYGVKRIEEGNRKVILYFDEVCIKYSKILD